MIDSRAYALAERQGAFIAQVGVGNFAGGPIHRRLVVGKLAGVAVPVGGAVVQSDFEACRQAFQQSVQVLVELHVGIHIAGLRAGVAFACNHGYRVVGIDGGSAPYIACRLHGESSRRHLVQGFEECACRLSRTVVFGEVAKEVQLHRGGGADGNIEVGTDVQLRIFELGGVAVVVVGRFQYSVVVEVVQLREIAHELAAPFGREGEVVAEAVVAQGFVPPVYIGISVGMALRAERLQLFCRITCGEPVVGQSFVQRRGVGVSVCQFGQPAGSAHRKLIGEVNLRFALFAAFGLYEDNAVGALDSVKGGRCGIFQHGDRFYFVGTDLVERTLKPVYQHQRGGGAARTVTAYPQRSGIVPRIAGILQHLQSGNQAVKHIGVVDTLFVREFLFTGGSRGRGRFLQTER